MVAVTGRPAAANLSASSNSSCSISLVNKSGKTHRKLMSKEL